MKLILFQINKRKAFISTSFCIYSNDFWAQVRSNVSKIYKVDQKYSFPSRLAGINLSMTFFLLYKMNQSGPLCFVYFVYFLLNMLIAGFHAPRACSKFILSWKAKGVQVDPPPFLYKKMFATSLFDLNFYLTDQIMNNLSKLIRLSKNLHRYKP